MAKSAQGFPVSRGAGNNLSLFSLNSARLRETMILADSDGTGESLHVELPAHDSPDRGSPLKIGGKASTTAPTAVGELDRTDAWFTLNGQMMTAVEGDPATAYDYGIQPINSVSLTNISHGATLVSAPNLIIKLLAAYISCVAFTSVGTIGFGGSASGFFLARCTAINQNFQLPPSPYAQYYTLGLDFPLSLFYDGTASFNVTVVYYTTPGF